MTAPTPTTRPSPTAYDLVDKAVQGLGPWNDDNNRETVEAALYRAAGWGITFDKVVHLLTAVFDAGRREGDADAIREAAAAERAGD